MRSQSFAVAVLLLACADDSPPAVAVGPVSFTDNQLLGLPDSGRESLGLITAVGLAVADSTTLALGGPRIEEWTEDRLLQILAAELTLERNGVGDAALIEAYRTEPEWELTVEHLLVFSERWRTATHREAAAAKASRALELLEGGLDFPEVESRLAGDPGGEAQAGELPPGREGAWVPEFWAAALQLQPGELSPVTETQYGFHVLRLVDRVVVPFPDARSAVARRVAGTIESPAAVLEAWMAAEEPEPGARRAAAVAEARSRGIEVPPGERAEIARRWETQVDEWAMALGFSYGLTPGQIAEAAMAALARTGQNADLARRAIFAHAEVIRARYDILLGTESSAQP